MKITTHGFVAARPDGRYLYIRKYKDNLEISTVEELAVATVRNQPGAYDWREAKMLAPLDVTWKRVKVEREVTLEVVNENC